MKWNDHKSKILHYCPFIVWTCTIKIVHSITHSYLLSYTKEWWKLMCVLYHWLPLNGHCPLKARQAAGTSCWEPNPILPLRPHAPCPLTSWRAVIHRHLRLQSFFEMGPFHLKSMRRSFFGLAPLHTADNFRTSAALRWPFTALAPHHSADSLLTWARPLMAVFPCTIAPLHFADCFRTSAASSSGGFPH
jgi:hypothetical protein